MLNTLNLAIFFTYVYLVNCITQFKLLKNEYLNSRFAKNLFSPYLPKQDIMNFYYFDHEPTDSYKNIKNYYK